MNKREKIRDGIYNIIEDRVMMKTIHTGGQIDELIAEIQKYEASQGVVLKVDRKLPELYFETVNLNGGNTETVSLSIPEEIRKVYAGYVAVEPLIEEEHGLETRS